MLQALGIIIASAVIAGLAGWLLSLLTNRFTVQSISLVEDIDALLPQTQCGQCGHPGCKPYAKAIAEGAPINRCPPGGSATIEQLASLLNRDIIPLNTEYGVEEAFPSVAFIREEECIGCTKCIAACPVDAILGAHQYMHTVIRDECTGCKLCIEPCPVDCIDLKAVTS